MTTIESGNVVAVRLGAVLLGGCSGKIVVKSINTLLQGQTVHGVPFRVVAPHVDTDASTSHPVAGTDCRLQQWEQVVEEVPPAERSSSAISLRSH